MEFPVPMLLIKLLIVLMILSKTNAQETSCTTPSFEEGYCVPYKDCPFVTELYEKYGANIPQYLKDYIYHSKCSGENENGIRLCCKLAQPTSTTTTKVPETLENRFNIDLDTNQDVLSQLNPEGFNILHELSCGSSDGNRVAGGEETDLAEFPWMALLKYDVVSGDPYLCGGTLVSHRYVLTATHCVNRDTLPLIGVRLGEHDLAKDEDCVKKGPHVICNPPVEDYGIEKIIKHPQYNERRRINDIALIKLDRHVEFKKHIQPICLPITSHAIHMKSQDGYFICGWGTTEKGTKSSVLLKARVTDQKRSICQNAYRLEINQKHLCAGDLETGRDTCRGDSGGPLMLFSKYKNVKRYIQYGVVASGGLGCNLEQALPGIYTNVINYLPWITDTIATN